MCLLTSSVLDRRELETIFFGWLISRRRWDLTEPSFFFIGGWGRQRCINDRCSFRQIIFCITITSNWCISTKIFNFDTVLSFPLSIALISFCPDSDSPRTTDYFWSWHYGPKVTLSRKNRDLSLHESRVFRRKIDC